MGRNVKDILQRYYDEANGGMVQKPPSTLKRGEGAEKEYYIYKIDIVGSTDFLRTRTNQTYLKVAHTFLSTVDEITRHYGANEKQVEYVGDGIIAYFPLSVSFIDVLASAFFCREAALQMKSLDATLARHPFHTKTVIHYGKLIMANIGPYGDSFVTAIGKELHKACKMESQVSIGGSVVSKEFYDKLDIRYRHLLSANVVETKVPKEISTPSLADTLLSLSQVPPALGMQPRNALKACSEQTGFRNSLAGLEVPAVNRLMTPPQPRGLLSSANLLAQFETAKPTSARPNYEIRRDVVSYSIKWNELCNYLSANS